jgi:CHAD domain-containing protein
MLSKPAKGCTAVPSDRPPTVGTSDQAIRTSDVLIDLRSQPEPEGADARRAHPSGPPGPEPQHPASPGAAPANGTTKLGLQRDESLALGLQRMALEQFEIAVAGLEGVPDIETGVHRARKALKRVRALLRLVRDLLGHDVYRAENIVARDVARVLSPVRESFVLARTLDSLLAEEPTAISAAAATELRDHLVAQYRDTAGAILDDRDLMTNLLMTVRSAATRFALWPVMNIGVGPDVIDIRPTIPDRFDSLEPGLRRVYGRGRKRLDEAEATPTRASVHEWRKRVKYLRYQMEALTPLWPDVIGGLERALNTLSEVLGVEHDLADLAVLVHLEPDLISRHLDRNRLLAAIARRRAALQSEAFGIGDKVYVEAPRTFTARIGPYWAARQRHQRYAL